MVYKKGFFTYDESKGYISKTEEKTLKNLSENEGLAGFSFINNSETRIGDYYFAWFMQLKNFNTYKLMIYNSKEDKFDIKTFDFKVPRKFKVINKIVRDEKLKETKGLVSIFGYHRKGKKNTDIYPKTTFDFIYVNTKGEVVIDKKISHGTEKNYKNVITPIIITENNNKELNFVNNNQLTLLKANLEYFTLNREGEIKVNSTEKYLKIDGDKRYNYYQYLSGYDHVDRMGDYFVLRKIIEETPKTTNSDGTKPKAIKARVNVSILDKNFKPVNFYSYSIAPNINADVSFQNILMTNNELVTLVRKSKSYFMMKTSLNDSGEPTTDFKKLHVKYSIGATPKLYFGSFDTNFSLVDKENRTFYIMSQFYDLKTYGTKVIDKVGITKFKY